MEQQYLSVLEQVLRYERNSQRVVIVLFSVAMMVVAAAVVRCFRKEKISTRVLILGIAISLCAAFGVYCFVHHQYIQSIKADFEEHSFVTYSGSFLHDDYQRDSFYHNLVIAPDSEVSQTLRYPDYGNQYQLHSAEQVIPFGTGSGTVVYGKYSKIVLRCVWEEV